MAAAGWTVKCIANKTMDRLIARAPGVAEVLPEDVDIPSGTTMAALAALPGAYARYATFWNGPYLSADLATFERWGDRLDAAVCRSHHAPRDADLTRSVRTTSTQEVRIGLAWRGNPKQGNDERRSFEFERFAPLFRGGGWRVAGGEPDGGLGVSFISLQKGCRDELAAFNRSCPPPATHHPLIADLGDEYQDGNWCDTAAVIANLDLVISADTGVAHLAGAMGKPVWLALSEPCCWRWGQGRKDEGGRMKDESEKTPEAAGLIHPSSFILHPSERSVWYPTMRIFRQARRGSWDGVFEAMSGELVGAMQDQAA